MKKFALVGNPNTGKTSIFNRLTGLNQHVGNFPGVTVDKKTGILKHKQQEFEIIDFPGTYSIYPHSEEEKVVYSVFSDPKNKNFPDSVIVTVDGNNLERNLLLFTQIYDLNIPLILVINMSDIAARNGIEIDIHKIKTRFPDIQICKTNARIGFGMNELKEQISQIVERTNSNSVVENYQLASINDLEGQSEESKFRYQFIKEFVSQIQKVKIKTKSRSFFDKLSVHPIFGYLIFISILLLIFQLVFSIATVPMDLIDGAFTDLANWISVQLPSGLLNDLITGGIIPGLGGVLVFIPQIILLFLCIGILEETGYLARAVFIMDRLMRPFGLNGKSVVPLISSAACAIPGIMATRTIPNKKERLITILVAPLMSCSARIPVYTLLIALVVPSKYYFGFLNLQGLILMAMYLLGIFSALFVAWILKKIIKSDEVSYFLMEIPDFKSPRWGNIFITLLEKTKIFILEAGKVILAISIILWALASFGPGDRMEKAIKEIDKTEIKGEEYSEKIASIKLENSYIGIIGKTIEPAIKPLGFDWKIGISLITSFAAREVFVGSMATIYSVHQEDNQGLISSMRNEKTPEGKVVYTFATGVSLMVFYVFAMQCMATLAVVKRETNTWKWPIIQLVYMGILAYLASLLTYTILS